MSATNLILEFVFIYFFSFYSFKFDIIYEKTNEIRLIHEFVLVSVETNGAYD